MCALLAKAGCEVPEGTTSHAIKSTTLSWCAKYGMDKHPRLQLGHHSAGDNSLDAYGRDILAPSLLKYTDMLRSIRRGVFMPDLSRSGRFVQQQVCKVEVSEDEASLSQRSEAGGVAMEDGDSPGGLTGSFVRVDCAEIDEPEKPKEPGNASSSGSDSSSADEGPDDEWVRGEDFRHPSSKPSTWKPEASMYKHVRTGVVHLLTAGNLEGSFVCGRALTGDHVEVTGVPFLDLRKCKQCELGRPVRDIGSLNVALGQIMRRNSSSD